MLKATIIVVNYNGGAALGRCVESLTAAARPDSEIIVVDNASTDGSRQALQALTATGAVKALLLERNYGYAGAINRAAAGSTAPYIVALNMDLEVAPGWLDPLLAFMDATPGCGAVTPLIRATSGGAVTAAGQRVHVSGLGFNRTDVASTVPPFEPFEVTGIHGAAFLFRRELWARLGGMDEDGFLYHEDVNFSWMLRLAGYSLYCVPASVVYHDYFLSMYPEKLFLLERNRLAMLLSYLKLETLALLVPVLATTEAMTWGYAGLRGRAFVKAKAASYKWVAKQHRSIAHRRRWASDARAVSDWQLLRKLELSYELGQMLTLARERGASRRVPRGGPTVKVE